MTVQELITHLQKQPPNSEVFLITQPRHPSESNIHNVVQRKQFTSVSNSERNSEDVIIVEGSVVGFGGTSAWEVKNN